ncbi:MAG: thiamine phosphate synthase [Candidatus Saganbacteria bacterium]|nr:thiamine phosphate synthase [Candidatus Saganbacteria bacterium]
MSRILRIIDANTNRVQEGLRVVEEISRFVLNDKKVSLQIKKMRQIVKSFTIKLKASKYRDTRGDVGRRTYSKGESKRSSVYSVFKSNIKRAEEGLRCLEEFSKLIDPQLGRRFKELRFQSYDLESELDSVLQKNEKLDFNLYLVTDPMKDHIRSVREAIAGGIKIVQLRDKFASKKRYLKLAEKIRKITRKAGVTFIVNDSVQVAKKVNADGVHLGQKDGNPKQARKILGEDKLIGVSIHNLSEALRAEREGADYIALGNIFETESKPGKKGVGVRVLGIVRKKVKIPIVAIGGINKDNLHQIKDAGVRRVAVIRAVLKAKNIKKTVREILP